MAKKAPSAYMTTLERVLGGVHFCVYLLVLPFVTGPLFALLERLVGSPIPDSVQNMIYYYVLFAVTVVIFWNYLGRTTGYFLSAPWRTLGTALMGLVAFYGLNELAYRLLDLALDGLTNLNDVAISAQVRDAPGPPPSSWCSWPPSWRRSSSGATSSATSGTTAAGAPTPPPACSSPSSTCGSSPWWNGTSNTSS